MKIALVQVVPMNELRPQLGAGIAYLKSYAKKHEPQIEIDLFLSDQQFHENFEVNNYDLIGLSTVTACFKEAKNIAKDIKGKNSTLPIILGGSHITAFPDSIIDDCFSLGVVGEGELTFLEIIRVFMKKQSLSPENISDIKGICFNCKGELIYTGCRDFIEDIDAIPSIDKEFLLRYKTLPLTSTSRGCPFSCKYCQSNLAWKSKLRFHSPQYVLNEILELRKLFPSDNRILFKDDTFTANKKVLSCLKENIDKIRGGRDLIIVGSSHINFINTDTAKMLKELGVRKLNFGIESGSDRLMRILKRNSTNIDRVNDVLETCYNNGIKAASTFLIGTPEETEDDLKRSYEFILKNLSSNHLYMAATLMLTPLPDNNSEYWQIAVKKYNINHKVFDWSRLDLRGYLWFLTESQKEGSIDDWWKWRNEKLNAIYIGGIKEEKFLRIIEPYEKEIINIVLPRIEYDRQHKL